MTESEIDRKAPLPQHAGVPVFRQAPLTASAKRAMGLKGTQPFICLIACLLGRLCVSAIDFAGGPGATRAMRGMGREEPHACHK